MNSPRAKIKHHYFPGFQGNLFTGFKVLLKYLGQYRKKIVFLSIMGVLSAIGNGVIPYVAGQFFNAIITPSPVTFFSFVLLLYGAMLVLWAVIQCITYIIDWRINIMSEYLSRIIWLDYISHGFGFLLNLPISFHKKYKIGEIGYKINTAGNALETIAGRVVIDLAPQILSIVIALAVAFYMKPLLALFLVIGLCVYIFTLVRKVKPLSGLHEEYWNRLSESFGDAYDAIGNAVAIKQATTEEYEMTKLSREMKGTEPIWMRLTRIWGDLSLYQRVSILITQVVIFIVSVFYIHQGTMTIGELLAFNAYASMIFGPFVTIARSWQTIQNGIINILEMEKIFQLEPETYEPKDALSFDICGDIDFKDVSFFYDAGKPVLVDVSFSVKAGSVVALVGESGVGKSTLIELISAYHFPTEGEVTIDGHDVKTLNLRSLRSQIAVVPQEVVLFNDTIKSNIKYGNFNAGDEEMEEAARKAYAFDFIKHLPEKWNQVVGEHGVMLSVGQKQRIAIARAMLRNPRILILDEPTAALDAYSERMVTQSMDEIMKGKTTFIIAHRLSTVRKADLILVLKGGKVVESGAHEELMNISGGEYKKLYNLQIGLVE